MPSAPVGDEAPAEAPTAPAPEAVPETTLSNWRPKDKPAALTTPGPAATTPSRRRSKPPVQGQREKRFTCKFVFVGIDPILHADFELVPRLIGRGGANMRAVAAACDGKVRLRGRGSGHFEGLKDNNVQHEADVPLQIALSCRDSDHFEAGKDVLLEMLQTISGHFVRYCKKRNLEVAELFTIVEPG